MKKVLSITMLVLISSLEGGVTPLLLEGYQETQITIPTGENGQFTLVELEFSLDSNSYVQFASGAIGQHAKIQLVLDVDTLPPIASTMGADLDIPLPITYTSFLEPGEHSVSLILTNYFNLGYPTTCSDGYLQALIFLPEGGGAVAEQQPVVEPVPEMESVISKAPYVNVAGAAALFDASGREIEHAIQNDRVTLSTLAPGTYFAKDNEDRTVVKIVKVD